MGRYVHRAYDRITYRRHEQQSPYVASVERWRQNFIYPLIQLLNLFLICIGLSDVALEINESN